MIFIAHRGNTRGTTQAYICDDEPTPENHPDYIDQAIKEGFDVEVDVWVLQGRYFLGHDRPKYEVRKSWLAERSDSLWIHCKNFEALSHLEGTGLNYFWHEEDSFALTSKGYIWEYPNIYKCGVLAGWCSDYVDDLKIQETQT